MTWFDLDPGLIIAVLVLLGVVALGVTWWIPKHQARRWANAGISGRELAELENSARATIVQIVGGLALLLTFAATWIQLSDTRKATNRTLRVTTAQLDTERFTRAIEQLGSSNREVRIGGIYGLEGVAAEASRYRAPAVQVLLAYLHREHGIGGYAYKSARRLASRTSEEPVCTRQLQRFISDDTQAALSVVLRFSDAARDRFKLTRTDATFFRQVRPPADFSKADLASSYLSGAHLPDARFDGAILDETNFAGACLRGASFKDARATRDVNFDAADLNGADLSDAKFPASFRSADLRGADISGVEVTRGSFKMDDATIDACTRLPWTREVARPCPEPQAASP